MNSATAHKLALRVDRWAVVFCPHRIALCANYIWLCRYLAWGCLAQQAVVRWAKLWQLCTTTSPEPVFVKEPRNRFQTWGPVRQPYLSYRPARLHRPAESIPGLLKRLQRRAQHDNLPVRDSTVEGLYCKRPIQCLASSEILTPHCPASVYPPAFGAGGRTHSLIGEGWEVNSSEDVRHCSVLYICKYFVDSTKFFTTVTTLIETKLRTASLELRCLYP